MCHLLIYCDHKIQCEIKNDFFFLNDSQISS